MAKKYNSIIKYTDNHGLDIVHLYAENTTTERFNSDAHKLSKKSPERIHIEHVQVATTGSELLKILEGRDNE